MRGAGLRAGGTVAGARGDVQRGKEEGEQGAHWACLKNLCFPGENMEACRSRKLAQVTQRLC